MSAGTATNWVRPPFDGQRALDFSSLSFACRNPIFGSTLFQTVHAGHENILPKVHVAADYSDSVPDSSRYAGNLGYHPLEEVRDHEEKKRMLTDAEVARTTVEANNTALLILPGMVHSEPHRHDTWADFQYIIDDYGDIFFEIFDDENILLDNGESNPVMALIGMDDLHFGSKRRMPDGYNYDLDDEAIFETTYDNADEVKEISDVTIDGGLPSTSSIHPTYFAKCLIKAISCLDFSTVAKDDQLATIRSRQTCIATYIQAQPKSIYNEVPMPYAVLPLILMIKAVQVNCAEKMDRPSNGVSIIGCLRPAFTEEASYLRRFLHGEDSDGYLSEWRDEAEKVGEQTAATYESTGRERSSSTLYKLEIMTMELFSLYGDQTTIDLQDFQDVDPDVLVHCAAKIMQHFNEHEINGALKALCRKKKGIVVERAHLIGVDSLGMDVRISTGVEAQTIRFPFNAHIMSQNAAEKKIRRMLFPRKTRKNLNTRKDMEPL